MVKSINGIGLTTVGGDDPSKGPVLWFGLQSLNDIFLSMNRGSLSTVSPISNLPEIISISNNFGTTYSDTSMLPKKG